MKKQPCLAASAAAFSFFSSLQVANSRLVKKKKKSESADSFFPSTPKERKPLEHFIFSPTGLRFTPPPFCPCQQKLQLIVVEAKICHKCRKSQEGGGCHRSQGSWRSAHWLSSDLSWTCSSSLVYEKLFWNAILLPKSQNSLSRTSFLPAGKVDAGFACLCACTLSEREVDFLVQLASLGGGREQWTWTLITLMYFTLIRPKPSCVNFIGTLEIEGH